MTKRTPFDKLSAELTQAAKTLTAIEGTYRLTTHNLPTNSNKRKAQLKISKKLKELVIKDTYNLLRDELEYDKPL